MSWDYDAATAASRREWVSDTGQYRHGWDEFIPGVVPCKWYMSIGSIEYDGPCACGYPNAKWVTRFLQYNQRENPSQVNQVGIPTIVSCKRCDR